MKKYSFSKGFTLVELLVVIAIIGILATLLLLQLNVARAKARDTKRVGDINQLRAAVELYYDDNAEYPNTLDQVAVYMGSGIIPSDPSGGAYGYGLNVAKTAYQVYAELENYTTNTFNSDSDINGAGWPGGVNGALEVKPCTSAANDCVFDLGVKE